MLFFAAFAPTIKRNSPCSNGLAKRGQPQRREFLICCLPNEEGAMSATDVRLETVDVGGLRMRVASQGEGPLVLLCHGFPESWRSWRSQLEALAAAGFRAAAPDMRGHGGTDRPKSARS